MWRLYILALLVGCDGCGSGANEAAGSTSIEDPSGEQSAGSEEEESREPEKLSEVVVSVAEDSGTGHFQLSVQNHDDESVRVNRRVVVERREGDGFTEVSTEFQVRSDCSSEPPECPELAVGGEFLPPLWRGETGQAQCDCESCTPLEEGDYRVVVFSCERNHRYESPVFAIQR